MLFMQTVEPVGLRGRKRQETRARLEQAAVSLVVRDGLEHATICAISDLADVSPRTFFNYFESKEDAVLGLSTMKLSDESFAGLLERNDGTPLVEAVIDLMMAALGSSIMEPATRASRIEILRRYPELLARQMVQLNRMHRQLVSAVVQLLDTNAAAGSPTTSEATADTLLALCGGAIRVAVREWVADGRDSDEQQLQQRAAELVREVSRTIQ
jgi:AcrR family transcriptional regulator